MRARQQLLEVVQLVLAAVERRLGDDCAASRRSRRSRRAAVLVVVVVARLVRFLLLALLLLALLLLLGSLLLLTLLLLTLLLVRLILIILSLGGLRRVGKRDAGCHSPTSELWRALAAAGRSVLSSRLSVFFLYSDLTHKLPSLSQQPEGVLRPTPEFERRPYRRRLLICCRVCR